VLRALRAVSPHELAENPIYLAKKLDELKDVDEGAARTRPEDVARRAEERAAFLGNLDMIGKRVLDIGCGYGPDLLAMSRLGAGELFGLDISPSAVKLAREILRDQNAHLLVADALALPFRDGCFDVVSASHMLHHHPWPLVSLIVSEVARVLRPGGALVVREPCPSDERAALLAEVVEVLHDLGVLLKVLRSGGRQGLPEELKRYMHLRSRLFGFSRLYPTAFRHLLAQAGFRVEELAIVGGRASAGELLKRVEERARELPLDEAEKAYVRARIEDLREKLELLGYKSDCRLLLVARKPG